jgi:hypothetical protein
MWHTLPGEWIKVEVNKGGKKSIHQFRNGAVPPHKPESSCIFHRTSNKGPVSAFGQPGMRQHFWAADFKIIGPPGNDD